MPEGLSLSGDAFTQAPPPSQIVKIATSFRRIRRPFSGGSNSPPMINTSPAGILVRSGQIRPPDRRGVGIGNGDAIPNDFGHEGRREAWESEDDPLKPVRGHDRSRSSLDPTLGAKRYLHLFHLFIAC